MNKKIVRGVLRLMLALQFTVLLSGCWERKELNEVAFVLGIGIDKAEIGYTVSMQVVIPSAISSQASGGGGGNGVPVVVYKFTVPTFYDAQRKLNLDSSRTSYLGHIRVLVIGRNLPAQEWARYWMYLKEVGNPVWISTLWLPEIQPPAMS